MSGLTKLQRDLLERGAATWVGIIGSVGMRDADARKALMGLERKGLVFEDGVSWFIQPAGREAVAAVTGGRAW